jgi:hypothetical protein
MIDLDTLVHRMMDIETKYYELQSKYQTLIHQYEQLKTERSEGWKSLSLEECEDLEFLYGPPVHPDFSKDEFHCLELIRHTEYKLKEKNENCPGHRNNAGSSNDSPSGNKEP